MSDLGSFMTDAHEMLAHVTGTPAAGAWLTAAGVAGAILYLTTFTAVQAGRLRGDSITYSACNTVAALLVLSSLSVSFNTGAFIIQTSFATIGTIAIVLKLRARRIVRVRALSGAERFRP